MVSLIETSLLFFLLFNIICITSPMNVLRRIGSSSSRPSKSDAEEPPKDPKKRCVWEVKKIFKEDSGLDNFLYAFEYLNEGSFENDEHRLAKRYFENICDNLDKIRSVENSLGIKIDLPDLWSPQDWCHQRYLHQETENKFLIKNNTGCEADFEGAICIKYVFRNWKINLRALPGTEHLSDDDLMFEIRLKYGKGYRRDISFNDLIDALHEERFYPNPFRRHNYYRYPGDSLDDEVEDDRFDDTTLLDEYERRRPAKFDKYYADYIYRKMRDFGGSAFSDIADFCDNTTDQQRGLTIDDQKDPYDSEV